MNKSLIIFLFCYLPLLAGAQKVSIEFNGLIHCFNDTTDILPNTKIIIKKDLDTIGVLFSDDNGNYTWINELSAGDEITITAERKFFESRSETFKVPSFSTKVKLDLGLIEILINRLNSPFFEKNISDQFTGFDIDLMKHQLRKLENYCIEFIHVTYSNESDEIAQRRLKYFKQYLIQNNIDINNFTFNSQNLNLNCNNEDCRGRIEGKVLSLVEKCN